MQDEYIRKADAVSIAESYEAKRDGFHLNDYEYGRNQVADSIASDLEDMPPADVVPVVRCRSCLHFDSDSHFCFLIKGYMQYDDFCSYGKTR